MCTNPTRRYAWQASVARALLAGLWMQPLACDTVRSDEDFSKLSPKQHSFNVDSVGIEVAQLAKYPHGPIETLRRLQVVDDDAIDKKYWFVSFPVAPAGWLAYEDVIELFTLINDDSPSLRIKYDRSSDMINLPSTTGAQARKMIYGYCRSVYPPLPAFDQTYGGTYPSEETLRAALLARVEADIKRSLKEAKHGRKLMNRDKESTQKTESELNKEQ